MSGIENINVLAFDILGIPVGDFSKVSLVIIMVSMGLTLTLSNFAYIFTNPRSMLVGLVGQLVLLPLVAFCLCQVFNLSNSVAVGIMLIACCPGAATSNFMTYLAKGELALSITLTAVTGIITIFTIPLILNSVLSFFGLSDQGVSLPILNTIWNIFILTGLPVILGMVIRALAPKLARRLEKLLTPLSFVALLTVMFMTFREVWPVVAILIKEALLPVFMLNLSMVVIGLRLGRLMQFSGKISSTIAIEIGFQNYVLAIVIAIGMLNSPEFSIPSVVYLFSMYVTAIPVVLYARAKHRGLDAQL
jgi:BASS family bile acid:Na+ symporter